MTNSTLDATLAPPVARNDDTVELDTVDIDTVWAEAEPLMAAALEGSDDSTEDLYHSCKAGYATFLATNDVFLIVQEIEAPRGKFDLLVWAAVSRGATDCTKTHLAAIERAAFEMGARFVAFRSQRMGFSRLLPDDWAVRQVTWAKRLH